MIVGSRENILHALSYKNVPTQPSKIAHYNFKLVHYCCSGSDAITSARSSRWPAACCRSITSWRWRRRRRFTDECKRDQGRLVVAYDPNRNQIRWVGSGLYTILQPRPSLKFSARSTSLLLLLTSLPSYEIVSIQHWTFETIDLETPLPTLLLKNSFSLTFNTCILTRATEWTADTEPEITHLLHRMKSWIVY